ESGDMVVLSRGDLAGAMRASMAVPGVFPPVERATRVLVDGGMARNLPVDVARGVCGDVVIAVDVGSPLLTRQQTQDALSISDQAVRALMQRNVDEQVRQLGKRDILVRPDLGNMSPAGFADGTAAIAAGEAAAQAALPALLGYQLDVAAYAEWRAALAKRVRKNAPIAAVEVEATRYVNPAVVKEALDIKPGAPLPLERLHAELGRLYASGDFEQIDYRVLPGPQGDTLEVRPREKPWGPGYLDFGLGLRTDFNDDAAFELGAQYRRSWLNRLGGEFKARAFIGSTRGLQTAFHQPLTLGGSAFVAANAGLVSEPFELYYAGSRLAQYRRAERQIGLDIGSGWGQWGEARIGLVSGKVNFSRSTGDPTLRQGATHVGGLKATLVYDQLDDALYPREGGYAKFDYFQSLTGLGATAAYTRSTLDLKQALRHGSWSTLLALKLDHTHDAPDYAQPASGGLFQLSGFQPGELRAASIAQASIRISQDLAKLSPLFGRAGFWGMALEGGKLWRPLDPSLDPSRWLHSETLFIGSDTRLGPAYFAIAYGSSNKVRTYLMVNGQF
ncbi:patatin-like phospholipase family protein, partial [Chitinimonas sp.]|uniref:patatin-like phospholipase family protein n=1 Tax=Chitinimonas sp. TaxID=1934313 RepID=UPI0035B416E3